MDDETLTALVDNYRKVEGKNADVWWATFNSRSSMKDAIDNAMMPGGKKHKHQHRLKRAVLKKTADRLLRNGQRLINATTFEDIMRVVQGSRVKGFGTLAIYDVALRVGLSNGILPTCVYLHAGTRKGARRLRLNASKSTLRIDELPKPLRALQPHHVENFLCIYKDDFGSRLPQHLRDCINTEQSNGPC